MEQASVLITGSGAPGIAGTVYSLRNNPDNRAFRLITTDIKGGTIGEHFCDAFYNLPAPEKPEYLPALKQLVLSEKINVIVPQTTREIIKLSQNKDGISSWGCGVVVSEAEAIRRANDKYLIIKECENVQVPYPEYELVKDLPALEEAVHRLGFPQNPVVVKPRLSNGLRGVRILTKDTLSLEQYLGEKPAGLEMGFNAFKAIFSQVSKEQFPELLVSEYLPGEEYTVDAFRNAEGTVIIPRWRKAIRSGISFETVVDLQQKDIITYSEKLAQSLNLMHCFGFQFKLDRNQVPKILESNPRVQGTMVTSVFANFNMIYYSVLEAMGIRTDLANVQLRDKVEFKRYWGGIAVDDNTFLGKL